jgi:uncharacterized membrane protein
MQQKKLYFSILAALFMLLLFSLGSGFWGGEQAGQHWTEKLFYGVCHQLPDRSLFIFGSSMAVNSRCFGIFFGLFAGWAFIPISLKFTIRRSWPVKLLLVAVMLQIIDFTGNIFQLWENTNLTRVLLGMFLGVSSSLAIGDQFNNNSNQTT